MLQRSLPHAGNVLDSDMLQRSLPQAGNVLDSEVLQRSLPQAGNVLDSDMLQRSLPQAGNVLDSDMLQRSLPQAGNVRIIIIILFRTTSSKTQYKNVCIRLKCTLITIGMQTYERQHTFKQIMTFYK